MDWLKQHVPQQLFIFNLLSFKRIPSHIITPCDLNLLVYILEQRMQKIVEVNLKFQAHGSAISDDLGEIQSLISLKDKYISVGLDCQAKLWNFDYQPLASAFITGDYPLCMLQIDNSIVIGNGTGDIIFFDADLKQQKLIKVARDVISDIYEIQDHILVLSHDGTITVLLKSNHSVFKRIDLEFQISKICRFEDSFYIGGSKSWRISCDFERVQEIQRSNQFLVHNGELLGVSPSKGFYSFSRQIFSNSPCDLITIINGQIIGFFSEGVSLYNIDDEQISTKSQLIKEWKSGYIVKTVCSKGGSNFLVGREDGSITDITLLA